MSAILRITNSVWEIYTEEFDHLCTDQYLLIIDCIYLQVQSPTKSTCTDPNSHSYFFAFICLS